MNYRLIRRYPDGHEEEADYESPVFLSSGTEIRQHDSPHVWVVVDAPHYAPDNDLSVVTVELKPTTE